MFENQASEGFLQSDDVVYMSDRTVLGLFFARENGKGALRAPPETIYQGRVEARDAAVGRPAAPEGTDGADAGVACGPG